MLVSFGAAAHSAPAMVTLSQGCCGAFTISVHRGDDVLSYVVQKYCLYSQGAAQAKDRISVINHSGKRFVQPTLLNSPCWWSRKGAWAGTYSPHMHALPLQRSSLRQHDACDTGMS